MESATVVTVKWIWHVRTEGLTGVVTKGGWGLADSHLICLFTVVPL